MRNDCAGWANEVEAALPSLVFAIASTEGGDLVDVRVSANGKLLSERIDGRAIDVDPGVYQLRFEAADHAPLEQTITVREAEKSRLVRVELQAVSVGTAVSMSTVTGPARESAADYAVEPAPPRRVLPVTAIVLGSVAVAAGATALGFGIWGKQRYDDQRAQGCGDTRSCDTSAGKRAYVIADVGAGVAAASAVAAVWVYVAGRRKEAPRVNAQLGRDGFALSYTRSF